MTCNAMHSGPEHVHKLLPGCQPGASGLWCTPDWALWWKRVAIICGNGSTPWHRDPQGSLRRDPCSQGRTGGGRNYRNTCLHRPTGSVRYVSITAAVAGLALERNAGLRGGVAPMSHTDAMSLDWGGQEGRSPRRRFGSLRGWHPVGKLAGPKWSERDLGGEIVKAASSTVSKHAMRNNVM